MKLRIPALVFLIVANIVLLAHAVVPHHHHEETVCLVNSHCEDEHNHEHEDHHHHDHEHDSSQQNTGCILNLNYFVPTVFGKQEFTVANVLDLNPNINAVQATLLGTSELNNIFRNHYSDAPPIFYGTSLYYKFVARVQGLRAPPVA